MPRHAVVDTNVLVSALLKRGSYPDKVAQAVRRGQLQPVVCTEIVAEYVDVLRRPKLGLPQHDALELLESFAAQAQWVRITPYLAALNLPDPGDWPFVATALAAECPVITGNTRHFPARLGLEIMTARQWAEIQCRPAHPQPPPAPASRRRRD